VTDRDSNILAEFRRRLPDDVKTRLKAILAYGSRVRGDAREDSDLDVVALVEENTPDLERALEDVAYDVMWDFDFNPIVSLKVFTQRHFDRAARQGFSYYRNVLSQGVSV
jgi:uncharacterized protein